MYSEKSSNVWVVNSSVPLLERRSVSAQKVSIRTVRQLGNNYFGQQPPTRWVIGFLLHFTPDASIVVLSNLDVIVSCYLFFLKKNFCNLKNM